MSIDWGQVIQSEIASIQGQQQQQALQQTLQTVLNAINATLSQVNVTNTLLQNGTYGLAALQAQIATFQALVSLDVTAILTAISGVSTAVGTPQQAGSPVTPWASFDNDVANDVWLSQLHGSSGPGFNEVMNALYNLATFGADSGLYPYTFNNLFRLNWDPRIAYDYPHFLVNAPTVTWADVSDLDTLDSWLAKDTSGLSWGIDPNDKLHRIAVDSSDNVTWWCIFTPETFLFTRDGVSLPPSGPPLWPGLAGVVLGTPVALDSVLTVSVPCDGCLIHITGAPTKQGQFVFGGLVSYRNAGALSFVTDDGEAEFPQLLGFTDAVYCPRSMAHASGLVLRASPGVTGTVTPWTLS